MISSTGFRHFEDRARIDWDHVFDGSFKELRVLMPKNVLRGSERYIVYWQRLDDVLASVYLSLTLDGRGSNRLVYYIGADISHIPTAKILGELTGNYRPFRPLVRLDFLNYFFRQKFSEFVDSTVSSMPKHLANASEFLSLEVWQEHKELVLEYYCQGINKELIPWLRDPEALVAKVLENRLRPHLEDGVRETAVYSMEEIAFLLHLGQFDRARSATSVRLHLDTELARIHNKSSDTIEAERKLHEQADEYFESKVFEYIYRHQ